jgi:hypothetical protein
VRTQDDRRPSRGCISNEGIDDVATFFVETSMRFVKQPKFWTPRQQTGKRRSPPLTSRQTANRNIAQSAIETKLRHCRFGIGHVGSRCPRPEMNIVGNSEFVVEASSVRQQSNPMTHSAAVITKVDAQHNCFPRSNRHQPGERAQQRRLARPICAAQKNDAAAVDIKIDTGKGRESAEQGHRPAEVDHGLFPGPECGVVSLHGVP